MILSVYICIYLWILWILFYIYILSKLSCSLVLTAVCLGCIYSTVLNFFVTLLSLLHFSVYTDNSVIKF